MAEPNPLLARRHEIVVRSETGALRVTETILVENPTSTCYVGQAASEDAEPVKPEQVSCNLGPAASERRGEEVIEFESAGQALSAGHLVRLEMGRLPVPWMAYGRWLAPVALVGLIAGTTVVVMGRRERKTRQT